MKKDILFYTFWVFFVVTFVITLLGITQQISIREGYLNALFTSLVLELCAGVISLFIKTDFFSTKKSESKITESKKECKINPLEKDSGLLTPKKIIEEIHTAPPFQKNQIAENFSGLDIDWTATLWNIKEENWGENKGMFFVELHTEEYPSRNINFLINIDEYPRFRTLKRDDRVNVVGKIEKCSGEGCSVTVKVDKINFF